MERHIPPTYKAEHYHCPHCGIYAQQNWQQLQLYFNHPMRQSLVANSNHTEDKEDSRLKFSSSECMYCHEVVIWYKNTMIFPKNSAAPHPTADMPEDVRRDFNEARDVLDYSARASSALLRLALQRLCKHLGQPGKDLNHDIGELVKQGLPPRIQKAFDTVRIIGNNAVHPGEINLDDDQAIALTLFNLINFAVEEMITRPREIDEIYSNLPEQKLHAIEERDQKF